MFASEVASCQGRGTYIFFLIIINLFPFDALKGAVQRGVGGFSSVFADCLDLKPSHQHFFREFGGIASESLHCPAELGGGRANNVDGTSD